MLNPNIDLDQLRQEFSQRGIVAIHNALSENLAKAAYEAFSEVRWTLEISDLEDHLLRIPFDPDNEPINIPEVLKREPSEIDPQKLFFVRLIVRPGDDFPEPLKRIYQFMDSEEFVEKMIAITGRQEIAKSNLATNRYQTNCFLGYHDDDGDPTRVVTSLYYLTPDWRPDWGGLLMAKPKPNAIRVVPPTWNTLLLFRIPMDHWVSAVSAAATAPRYAITGWLSTKDVKRGYDV